ncbi:MAG: hypothetical protein MK132_16925 [Lentisphaerales bacterium]|nr:hypothetical protein [Lentisphaerales bacterium]
MQQKGPFQLSALEAFSDVSEEELEESDCFFWTFDNDGTRSFISKQNYFDDSHFSIHLAREEIDGGYLVATGRFIPFCTQSPKLVIDGVEVSLIKKSISPSCLKRVLSLDKGQSLLQALSEKYDKPLYSLDALVGEEIDVYDLSSVKEQLRHGAHLALTISSGELSGHFVQSDDIPLCEVQRWCEMMEKSFLGVLKEFGPFYDISQQLELAYFYGPSLLRESTSLALRDFMKLSNKLKVYDFIFRRTVWFTDQKPLDSHFAQEAGHKIQTSLLSPIQVNSAFFTLVPEESKNLFNAPDFCEIQNSELLKDLKQAVLRAVLWLRNSQSNLKLSAVPVEELLIFEVVFDDLQELCEVYTALTINEQNQQDLRVALKLNTAMLQEVCELLQIFYLSESFD